MVQNRRGGVRAAARWSVVALVGAGALAACSDVLGSDEAGPTTISFRAVSGTGAAASTIGGASLSVVPVTGGGHTVDLTSVDVLFDEVTLESANDVDDGDSEEDSDSDGRGNQRFRAGATTVSLPLNGTMVTPLTQLIPAGTYDGIELDAAFVRLRGTYDGQPFDVTVPVNAEIEADFEPPFVVDSDDDRPNITVNVNVLSWFRDANGTVIDPRRLAVDANLRAAFLNRIRASFRALEDEDRDGDEQDSDSDSR